MNEEKSAIDAKVAEKTALFTKMAERIERNGSDNFAAAMVIIPPNGGGDPIDTLFIDPKMLPEEFWTTLKSRCDLKIAEIAESQRTKQAFGRR